MGRARARQLSAPPAAGAAALPAGLDERALLAEVTEQLAGLPRWARVLLAVSGGPDSAGLAALVRAARPDLQAALAHVRHGLRDDHADAAAAAAQARALDLEMRDLAVDVGGDRPLGADGGLEAAARAARYRALAACAAEEGAAAVLTGHTADDQAETILLNAVRGAGLAGLSGMPLVRPLEPEGAVALLRPLLRLRREDVRAHAAGCGLSSVEDPTNRDRRRARAQLRHEALPALAALAGGSDPVAALTRLGELARVDAEALEAEAAAAAPHWLRRWGPVWALPAAAAALPQAVHARIVRRMLTAVRAQGAAELDAATVARVRALGPGQALHVGGQAWVTAGGGWLAAAPAALPDLGEHELAVPGRAALPVVGLAVQADWAAAETPQAVAAGPPGARQPAWARLAGETATPLRVRARRDGDRLGLAAGHRKLQDLLVDAGVPRALRELVPVVTDARDAPVWVPGIAARVCEPAAAGLRVWLAPLEPGCA